MIFERARTIFGEKFPAKRGVSLHPHDKYAFYTHEKAFFWKELGPKASMVIREQHYEKKFSNIDFQGSKKYFSEQIGWNAEIFEHAACTIRRKAQQDKALSLNQNASNSSIVMREQVGGEEMGEY